MALEFARPIDPRDLADSATVSAALYEILEYSRGMPTAPSRCLNPHAEELKQRTFVFALAVIRFCRILRNTWEGAELADQLFRSGTRIGANYRAACRGRSTADFINKLGHVVEEADETVYWLELIHAAGVCKDASLGGLRQESAELSAIFNRSQMTAKTNAGRFHTESSRIRRRPNS